MKWILVGGAVVAVVLLARSGRNTWAQQCDAQSSRHPLMNFSPTDTCVSASESLSFFAALAAGVASIVGGDALGATGVA